ncbi:hypothetical protein F4560_008647 [Saccharothrix ecbatanensis]|uniref:Uncharacterized protein n=1 Tax=Saccharothrix ecbatanensis TaxID=1105145 RepID=A0A7W9HUR5_9PSEU|nr:hypothetical protein [Saccharothrix ecbatanensis]MBB5808879.1 hypothetical protein [Saccharothrix ecbatanensis]
MITLSSQIRVRQRALNAIVSIVLAATIAVVVNVWTSGWGWPAGVGLATLVGFQALMEWRRVHAENQVAPARRWVTDQQATTVCDSDMTGIHLPPASGDVEVRQDLGFVERATIIGIDGRRD